MRQDVLPEPYCSMEPVFEGRRISVFASEEKDVDGRTLRREAVLHPGAVVILPLIDPQTILLIRNRRFVVDEVLWELPAGTRESGEPPSTTAQREVLEETGYRAGKLEPLHRFYTTPGFCNEAIFAYLATDLSQEAQDLDPGEEIEAVPTSLETALQWIKEGKVKDGKTIATLLFYQMFVRQA